MDAKMKKHLLLGDNEDHFLIDDGEVQFKVAKYMIDPRTRKKIESMERHQNFACGGEVKGYYDGGGVAPGPKKSQFAIQGDLETAEANKALIEENIAKESAEEKALREKNELVGLRAASAGKGYEAPGYTPPPIGQELVRAPSPAPLTDTTQDVTQKPKGIGIPQPDRKIAGPPSPNPFQKMEAAGQDYASSIQSVANQAKKSYDDAYNALKKSEEHYKVKRDLLDSRITQLQDDISSGKIDPNRYWSDKSTPNKILSAFAIALGGFGDSGKNGALDVINRQIDADIDAQKANLKNKESLLSKNIELLGDIRLAEEATRAQINAGLAAQLGKFNYAMLGPEARMKQAQLQAQFNMASRQMNDAIARKSAIDTVEGLGSSPATAEQLSLAGKEYKDVAVKLPGDTGYLAATTPKAAEEINTQLAMNQTINDALDEIQRISGGASYGLVERDRVKKLMRGLEINLAKRKGATQASEKILKTIRDMADDPRDVQNLVGFSSSFAVQDLKDSLGSETEKLMNQFVPGYKKPSKPTK